MLASCVVAFDHVRRTMSVIGPGRRGGARAGGAGDAGRAPAGRATRRRRPACRRPRREHYMDAVAEAKEHIAAGDAFQIVVSQRVRRSTERSPFAIYRALRAVNPSPYMFLLDLGGHQPGRRVAGDARAARPGRHLRAAADRRHPAARRRPRAGRRARRRAAGRRQGARRARDARRPRRATTCRPGLRAGHACGSSGAWRSSATRTSCTSVSQVDGQLPARRDALDAAAGDVPRRHGVRRAQGAGDADHRRARGRAAAASTPARSATSASAATWTPASRCAPSSCATAIGVAAGGRGHRGRLRPCGASTTSA